MKSIQWALASCLLIPMIGFTQDLTLYKTKNGQITPNPFEFILYKSLHVSKNCLKNRSLCFSHLKGLKTPPSTPPGEYLPNPASEFCEFNGGVSITLTDKSYNEYAICQFGDDYYFDAWDVFHFYLKANKN